MICPNFGHIIALTGKLVLLFSPYQLKQTHSWWVDLVVNHLFQFRLHRKEINLFNPVRISFVHLSHPQLSSLEIKSVLKSCFQTFYLSENYLFSWLTCCKFSHFWNPITSSRLLIAFRYFSSFPQYAYHYNPYISQFLLQ